jgi:hypothetical protein
MKTEMGADGMQRAAVQNCRTVTNISSPETAQQIRGQMTGKPRRFKRMTPLSNIVGLGDFCRFAVMTQSLAAGDEKKPGVGAARAITSNRPPMR